MSRKRDIDTAIDWAWSQDSGDGMDHGEVADAVASRAYDLGRIAGMREAAGRCSRYQSAYSVWLLRKEIRAEAKRLANKLRGANE